MTSAAKIFPSGTLSPGSVRELLTGSLGLLRIFCIWRSELEKKYSPVCIILCGHVAKKNIKTHAGESHFLDYKQVFFLLLGILINK